MSNTFQFEIDNWQQAKKEAVEATAREKHWREEVAKLVFPNPIVGTNTDEATGLKLIETERWEITSKDQANAWAIARALQEAGALVNPFKWKAEIDKKMYDLLTPTQQAMVDTVLTIKRGMPQLKMKSE
jgi:hypothetical protein